jgi:uncharacterized protein YgiM (DUF1202 family)
LGRVTAILSGILLLALLAGGLTEAALAIGHRGSLVDDVRLRPMVGRPRPASPTPSATPSPTPVPTAAATPVPAPTLPSATTNSFVHMRAGKSTSTAILTDLDGGTVVQVLPDSDAQWQQVQYNGLTGYIFKSYLNF